MGVGSVTSVNNMSGLQTMRADSTDIKSKNIQNEITDIEQKMRKLSSQEGLSADEKADERKKLQREKISLNTELERHQEEFLRAQKREMMMADLREDGKPEEDGDASEVSSAETTATGPAGQPIRQTGSQGTVIFRNSDGVVILKGAMDPDEKRAADMGETDEEEETAEENGDEETAVDTGFPYNEMHTMIAADASAKQADRQERVIAGINGGIAVLQGEIKQDEKRGQNVEAKQAQLDKMLEQEEKARMLQFAGLGGRNDYAFINISGPIEEERASQQRFYVSAG